MDYRELSPSPALRPYVRCYWTLRANADLCAAPQRVLPDGCVEMVINLGAQFVRHAADGDVELQPRRLLVGPTTRQMSIAPTGDVHLVGIRFAPGGALPFLAASPGELRDRAPSLDDAALRLAPELSERLFAAFPGAEGTLLDTALLERLARARRHPDARVRACVGATFASRGTMRVDAMVALTGLGARQLERRFREDVGFGPKTLCRLARFQRVVQALQITNVPSWARLAARSGYADQAHMAREFREFAGTTLTAYSRELHPMSDVFHGASVIDA